MPTEQLLREGIRTDHQTTSLDRDIKRLLQQEVLDDADRFYWYYLTSNPEDNDDYSGSRFYQ